jgi:hypothetical protein
VEKTGPIAKTSRICGIVTRDMREIRVMQKQSKARKKRGRLPVTLQ